MLENRSKGQTLSMSQSSYRDPCSQKPISGGQSTPLREESGQTTAIVALMLGTFLLGFVALGVDVEYLFHAKRMAQTAADAAAVAAGEESGNGAASEQIAANAMAKLNGFDTTLAAQPATVTLSTPTSGNYSGSTAYVQAIVSQPVPTYFIAVLNHQPTFTISARAVAGNGLTSPTCVCLEGTSGVDLTVSNGSRFSAPSCGITVDSTSSNAVGVTGSSTLSAISLGIASNTWTTANVSGGGTTANTKVVTGISTLCGPAMPPPPAYNASQCTADPSSFYGGGVSFIVGPGSAHSTLQTGNLVCYNSLTVGANGDAVNLNPGIYVINGGQLNFLSGYGGYSNTGGNGVFFYLVGNASLTISNGANVNLTAPSSGTYSGDLIFQNPTDTKAIAINGGSSTTFDGAIYAPSSMMTVSNGAGSILADIVAQTLTIQGGANISSPSASSFGTLMLSVAKLAE
jgi:Flp pilus assembly protein TadG